MVCVFPFTVRVKVPAPRPETDPVAAPFTAERAPPFTETAAPGADEFVLREVVVETLELPPEMVTRAGLAPTLVVPLTLAPDARFKVAEPAGLRGALEWVAVLALDAA